MKSHHGRDCQWCYDPGNHSDGVANSGEGPRRNQWKTKRKVSVPCWAPTLEPPPHTSTERTATLSDVDGDGIQAEFQNLCKSMQVLDDREILLYDETNTRGRSQRQPLWSWGCCYQLLPFWDVTHVCLWTVMQTRKPILKVSEYTKGSFPDSTQPLRGHIFSEKLRTPSACVRVSRFEALQSLPVDSKGKKNDETS